MPSTESGPAGAGPIRETGSARVKQTPSGALLPPPGDVAASDAGQAPSASRADPSSRAAVGSGARAGAQPASAPSRPNELRDDVAPNTLREHDQSWASWTPNGPRRWTPGAGAPTAKAGWSALPAVNRERIRRIGYWIAAVGVLPLLNAEVRWEVTGLAIMLAGVGVALVAAPVRAPEATPAGSSDDRRGGRAARRGLRAPAVPMLGAVLLAAGIVLALAVLVRP